MSNPPVPQYIRLPRNRELCPHSGMTRSYMNSLILPTKANNFAPPVASKVIKKQYASRGIRLVELASLMEFIAAQPNGGEASGKAPLKKGLLNV